MSDTLNFALGPALPALPVLRLNRPRLIGNLMQEAPPAVKAAAPITVAPSPAVHAPAVQTLILVVPATATSHAVYLREPGFPLSSNLPRYRTDDLADAFGVDRDTIIYHASMFYPRSFKSGGVYEWKNFVEVLRFAFYLAYAGRKFKHLRKFFG